MENYRGITLTSTLYKLYTMIRGKIREGNGRRKDGILESGRLQERHGNNGYIMNYLVNR